MKRLLVLMAVVSLSACGGSSDNAGHETVTTTRAAETPTSAQDGASSTTTSQVSPTRPTESNAGRATTTSLPTASSSRETLVPPAGHYVYETSGFTEGVAGGRQEPPAETTDDVTVARNQGSADVRILTREGQNEQEMLMRVAEGKAHLIRLSSRGGAPAATNDAVVTPDPPALLARLPFRVGDQWEIAWQDQASGMQGVGTGEVLGRETVASGVGDVDAFVVRVDQRLRGRISGRLTVTAWIDPATAIQVKQHIITEVDGPSGGQGDITRVLRVAPV